VFKKINKLKIFVITILISMVFAVNIGHTFASVNDDKVDYTMPTISTDVDDKADRSIYLNDVIVNNSTVNIPIAYTLGTVQREINFDYSFSETMDVAIKYELNYTDGTEVDNVILNVVDRNNYIWDQENILMDNYTLAYNSSSNHGTLYYLNTITGTGNMKLFSGVTFLTGNNKVNSYIANSAITIGEKDYAQNTVINSIDYQYTLLEISRFWEANEFNSLNQPTSYICRTGYSITASGNTNTMVAGTTKTATEYNAYIDSLETQLSGYWTKGYRCLSNFTANQTSYVTGTVYAIDQYNSAVSADSSNAGLFEICYTCNTGYSVIPTEAIVGSSNSLTAGKIITAEEYALLLPTEQAYFSINEYVSFENKNLTISVEVYTSISGAVYTADHYFKNLKTEGNGLAFSNWLKYKNGNIDENISMIYNGHAKFKNGVPYAIDFSASENMSTTLATAKSNLTSSYIYKKSGESTYFYSYAGGNKYNAGIGVYYLTASSPTKLTVQVSANWYNSNGDKISAMPINNINLQYAQNGTTSFTKNLSANSYGYVDVLEYIQTITEGDLFDMRGYSIVISSVTATFEDIAEAEESADNIQITNSTSYNPILYTLSNQGTETKLNFNITITNNSSSPIAIPTVTLDPTFTAYNGSTSISSDPSIGYGVVKQVNASSLTGFTYIYDNAVWSVSGNVFTGKGGYIAPYSSLIVVSGANVLAQATTGFWSFNLGGSTNNEYSADYWFEVGTSYVESSSNISYSQVSNYSSAEVITSLAHTKESTQGADVVSLIALRNNTLQTITAINYRATIQLSNSSSTVTYSVESDVTPSKSGNTFTVNLTGLTLYPGESMFICKLTIAKNQAYSGDYSVFLSSSSATVNLAAGDSSSRTGIYFKRDFASGNLSIINASTDDENGLQISGVSNIIGSGTKWNANNQFIMQDESDSLAKFRNGQIIHLLSNITSNLSGYSYSNLTIS